MCFKKCLMALDSNPLSENLIYCTVARFLSIFIFLFVFFLRAESVYGQVANTGANEIKANKVMAGDTLTIWAVPAEQKVRPDDLIETKNLVWSKEKKK